MGNEFAKKICCDAITGEGKLDDSIADIPLHRRIAKYGNMARQNQRFYITSKKEEPYDEELSIQKCKYTLNANRKLDRLRIKRQDANHSQYICC